MKPKYFLSFFLLAQLFFLQIIPYFPEHVEQFYSNGIYPIISGFSRVVFGKIPFSLGDFIYFITILSILIWLWYKRKSWMTEWKNNILGILGFISVFCFFFHLLWAMNYYREPLFEKMNIKKEYSDIDLLIFTKKLRPKIIGSLFQSCVSRSIDRRKSLACHFLPRASA